MRWINNLIRVWLRRYSKYLIYCAITAYTHLMMMSIAQVEVPSAHTVILPPLSGYQGGTRKESTSKKTLYRRRNHLCCCVQVKNYFFLCSKWKKNAWWQTRTVVFILSRLSCLFLIFPLFHFFFATYIYFHFKALNTHVNVTSSTQKVD